MSAELKGALFLLPRTLTQHSQVRTRSVATLDYQVSARKYRPGTFDDVIGQPHVVQTLVNSITTKRIAQAYLFSGTRGVGKTTVARILAKALNCEQGPTGTPCGTCSNCLEIAQGTSVDVMEIDGASNTSVDDVREIRENVKFAAVSWKVPGLHHRRSSHVVELGFQRAVEDAGGAAAACRVYLRHHRNSQNSGDDSLPLPALQLSPDCANRDRRAACAMWSNRTRSSIEERSLMALARASEGSMRDGLSLLDQAVAFGGKTIVHADLEALLGAVPQELVRAMIEAIAQDSPTALRSSPDCWIKGMICGPIAPKSSSTCATCWWWRWCRRDLNCGGSSRHLKRIWLSWSAMPSGSPSSNCRNYFGCVRQRKIVCGRARIRGLCWRR